MPPSRARTPAARLGVDPERQDEVERGTGDIGTIILSEPDGPQVVQELLQRVTHEVGCTHALLMLDDPEGNDVRLLSSLGSGGNLLARPRSGVFARVLASGRGEIVTDLAADPDTSPALAEAISARQIAAVPLPAEKGPPGVLAAANPTEADFAPDDLDALSAVAGHAAVLLANLALRAALERQSRELEALRRLAEINAAEGNVDRVVSSYVRLVAGVLGCEKVAVLLHDTELDALAAHPSAAGLSEKQLAELVISMARPTLAGTIFRTDATLVSNDAATDSWVDQEIRELLGIRSAIAAPVTSGTTTIGVLVAVNAGQGFFRHDDVELAELIARHLAGAITSARAQERGRALVHRLGEADYTKSDFISMVAHELKGPMTTVMGFAHMLRSDELSSEKRRNMLDIVTREVERLSRLVTDLLDMSRIEAGNVNYEFEPVSLAEVVEGLLLVHPSLSSDHLVTSRIPADLPDIAADPDRIRQALLNLLANAARYSPGGTSITVDAEVVDESGEQQVLARIKDEGVGITQDDRIRVFSKFVMLEKPRWAKAGTGLGLYITKGIVEAHGGRIWVESEGERGSTFCFKLPLAVR